MRISSTITCDGAFDVVASPNGTGHNDIFANSVISANDVWAVGVQTNAGSHDQTLAEHWNGSTWSIIPTPNPGGTTNHNDLNGVAAISTNDVWVVGDYFDSLAGGWLMFTMHWNGSGWTTDVINYGLLLAVTALATNNVWAVGTTTFAPFDTIILHFDGSIWTQAVSPSPAGFDNELFYVSAWSATDIWAVGEDEASSGSPLQSLAEHYNGSTWSVISTPNDAGGTNEVTAVTALEGGHAVGVGYGGFISGISAAHGEAWDLLASGGSTDTPLFGPGTGDNLFEGVAISGASVWAVGFSRATSTSARQTMAWPASWNSGTHTLTWGSIGTSASPGSVNNVLFAVAAVSPYSFWAVGYANSGALDSSLMESYCALHFGISAPAAAFAGNGFSMTATALNSNGTTATGYRGTVHFTSTDGGAALPADYTFTSFDAGSHTFSGVVLSTPYQQTITVSDTVTNYVKGFVTIGVTCLGACPAPTGTAGSRGANQTPVGTPGSRGTNQSSGGAPAGPPGSRIAALESGSRPGLSAGPQAVVANMTGEPQAAAPSQAAVAAGDAGVKSSTVETTQVGRTVGGRSASAFRNSVSGGNPTFPSVAGMAVALAVPLLLLARRRNNRRLHAKNRS